MLNLFEVRKANMDYLVRQVKIGYVLYSPYLANVPFTEAVHHRHEDHVRGVNGFERYCDCSRILV